MTVRAGGNVQRRTEADIVEGGGTGLVGVSADVGTRSGVRAGLVFYPVDKRTIRSYGYGFGEVDPETKPFHELSYVTVTMMTPEEADRVTAAAQQAGVA